MSDIIIIIINIIIAIIIFIIIFVIVVFSHIHVTCSPLDRTMVTVREPPPAFGAPLEADPQAAISQESLLAAQLGTQPQALWRATTRWWMIALSDGSNLTATMLTRAGAVVMEGPSPLQLRSLVQVTAWSTRRCRRMSYSTVFVQALRHLGCSPNNIGKPLLYTHAVRGIVAEDSSAEPSPLFSSSPDSNLNSCVSPATLPPSPSRRLVSPSNGGPRLPFAAHGFQQKPTVSQEINAFVFSPDAKEWLSLSHTPPTSNPLAVAAATFQPSDAGAMPTQASAHRGGCRSRSRETVHAGVRSSGAALNAAMPGLSRGHGNIAETST